MVGTMWEKREVSGMVTTLKQLTDFAEASNQKS